ncbi:MAG: hypothetical protein LQ347_003355, partial [Umbilicaria vellea]
GMRSLLTESSTKRKPESEERRMALEVFVAPECTKLEEEDIPTGTEEKSRE